MPLYDFRCPSCETELEILKAVDDPWPDCLDCKVQMKPLPSAFKTRKGAGIYSFDEPRSQNLGYYGED